MVKKVIKIGVGNVAQWYNAYEISTRSQVQFPGGNIQRKGKNLPEGSRDIERQ